MPNQTEDITKRYLEVFKQVATIDTAVALVILAARQAISTDSRWIAPALIMSGVSLFFAVLGLILSTRQRVRQDDSPKIQFLVFDLVLGAALALLGMGIFASIWIVALGF